MEMWAGPSNACWLLRKSDDLFLGVTLWPCSNNLSPALPKILATPLLDYIPVHTLIIRSVQHANINDTLYKISVIIPHSITRTPPFKLMWWIMTTILSQSSIAVGIGSLTGLGVLERSPWQRATHTVEWE